MSTRARPAQLRQHPRVQRWQAERARRSAQTVNSTGRGRPYRWPADKQAILETLAAARAESEPAEAPDEH